MNTIDHDIYSLDSVFIVSHFSILSLSKL